MSLHCIHGLGGVFLCAAGWQQVYGAARLFGFALKQVVWIFRAQGLVDRTVLKLGHFDCDEDKPFVNTIVKDFVPRFDFYFAPFISVSILSC